MMKLFLLPLLLLAPSLLLASPACFEGVWQLDDRKSDNLQSIRDRLQRKYRMDQEAQYRPGELKDKKPEVPLAMPAFLFLVEPLTISSNGADLLFEQAAIQRNINTRGAAKALSLKNLNNQAGTTVAGWEVETLVIETTTPDGTRVKERYQLSGLKMLKVSIVVNTGISQPITLEKHYFRDSSERSGCNTAD